MKLYGALDVLRRVRGLSWQEVADEICVSRTTLNCLGRNRQGISAVALLRVLHWLDAKDCHMFMTPGVKAGEDAN